MGGREGGEGGRGEREREERRDFYAHSTYMLSTHQGV